MLLFALPSPQRTLGTLPESTEESMIGTQVLLSKINIKLTEHLSRRNKFVVSLSEVGGLAEDARVVRSNMVENNQDADIESRTNFELSTMGVLLLQA